MSRVLLCVDLSYQVYRAAAAHPMLTSGRYFTGGLYGFMTTLAKMLRETQATDVLFCRDTKPYLRSEAYPDYKLLRKQKQDDELLKMYKASERLVLEVIDEIGLPVWGIPGFESDDLIAHVVTRRRGRYAMIYAGSNDSDLFQLLTAPNFAIYSKGIADIMTGARLLREQGITPGDYMLMTALTGTHNDIEGIRNVGPVKALKAIRDPSIMRAYRDQHGDLIDRNLGLIKLPHDAFPVTAKLPARRSVSFDARSLYRSLGRYDIEVTSAMVNSLEQLFHHETIPPNPS